MPATSKLELDEIFDLVLDDSIKGIPGGTPPFRLGDIGSKRWNILDGNMPFPVAVLKRTCLDNNRNWMRNFVSQACVEISPHGKTTMAPQLFDLQLADGAWGITAATATHIHVYRRFGVKNILLANQLVGPENIRSILELLKADRDFELLCLIDSPENLSILVKALHGYPIGRPLKLLLEVGAPLGRTGIREDDAALKLAKAVKETEPLVELSGVEAYEGIFDVNTADGRNNADRLLERATNVTSMCAKLDLLASGPIVITAGGTTYFDRVVKHFDSLDIKRPLKKIIRSGCYLTHDIGYCRRAYERTASRLPNSESPAFSPMPALEVISVIQSTPEDGRAIAALGKRDISFDVDLPIPLWCSKRTNPRSTRSLDGSIKVSALNDQHTYLDVSHKADIEVGDVVGFGISHPCTTFDKWSVIYLVDDEYNVVDAIKTFF